MKPPTHFLKVADSLYRSGQPYEDNWDFVKVAGIGSVLKLNDLGTGADYAECQARGIGLVIITIPDEIAQTELPHPEVLDEIDRTIDAGGPWLVHCTEGVDRTGIVIARWRVRHQGWTKDDAFNEWNRLGSHRYAGLVKAWNEWQPNGRR